MAINTSRSYTEYVVSEVQSEFAIGFKDYNKDNRDVIHTTIDDKDPTTLGYTITRISPTVIKLEPAVPVAVPPHVVRLQRETNIDDSFHNFSDGSQWNAKSMDENFEQIRHSQQESRDGYIKLRDEVLPLVDGLEEALETASEAAQAAQEAADAAEEAAQTTRSAEKVIDKSDRTQQAINDDTIRLKDYYKLAVGTDWSDAILQALADAKAQRKEVVVGGGTYDYSKNFTIEVPVRGAGREVTRFRKVGPAEITILKGCLSNITVSADAVLAGDTTRGVILDGLDRKDIVGLWVEYHGGHGIDFRRGNLSRITANSRFNNGRGLNMALDTLTGDNKAVFLDVETNANGLSGFYIEQSTLVNAVQMSSSLWGFVKSQNSGKLDVPNDNFDAVLTGTGHNLTLYCEYGKKSVWFRDLLKGSNLFFSNMGHTTSIDESNDTNTIRDIPSALGTSVTKVFKTEKLVIQKERNSYSGKLGLLHVGNNTFEFELTGTGGNGTIGVPTNLTLVGAGGTYKFARVLEGGATLNFSTIQPNTGTLRTITCAGVAPNTQVHSDASPSTDILAGLMLDTWISAIDTVAKTTTITIRLFNPTSTAKTPPQTTWRGVVFI